MIIVKQQISWDGPVFALRPPVELLAHDCINSPIAAGEIVTNRTPTRALPDATDELTQSAELGHMVAPPPGGGMVAYGTEREFQSPFAMSGFEGKAALQLLRL